MNYVLFILRSFMGEYLGTDNMQMDVIPTVDEVLKLPHYAGRWKVDGYELKLSEVYVCTAWRL